MSGLLSKLSNMRASSFVDSTVKTGVDKPALVATVKFDDGKKEEKVTFGQSGSDVFAGRTGEPGAAKADTADFNDVSKAFDVWLTKELPAINAQLSARNLQRIELLVP